jgi:MFS family permease
MDPRDRQEEYSSKEEGINKEGSYNDQEDSSVQEEGIKKEQGDNDTDNQSSETEEPVPGQQDVSRTEAPRPSGPSPVPNGGLQAWLHVVAGFFLFFNTWGILNAFGVFQTYYESGALFTESSSNISWIGAIQSFMLLTVGFVSGPLYDKGHLRILLIVGSFGIVFGHMMLSLCTTYWQVLLAQGFCVGIGAGCLFVPCVAILPTYFNTKLGLVVGLAASGSSFGGVIYPIVLYRLIDRIGFGWSVRVIGFIALGTLIFPIAVMKMRVKPPKARALIDWSAFTDFPFMLFAISTMIGFMGLYVLLFYLSFFAEDKGITDTNLAFYLVPIFNAASCFGRTLPNALSDRTGPFNMIAPGGAILGILVLCMMAVKSVAGIVVIAILSGFFSGVFIAMPPVCFVALTKDKSKIGTRIGMGFTIIALGVLAGGPGAGAILGKVAPLNWNGLWVFGGVTPLVAAASYAVIRVQRSGFKLAVQG